MEALACGPVMVHVGRLRKALYLFRYAPRAWNKKLDQELKGQGFDESNPDPALWILRGGQGVHGHVSREGWSRGSKNIV